MSLYDRVAEDKIPGGEGDKLKPSDVDPEELAKGIKVELEHTTDKEIAKEIALDHLAEDPKYYSKLATIHHEEVLWEGLAHISADAVVGGDPVADIMTELSDLPNKHGGAASPSTRTGLGTAPISDERPEQEKKDALRDALKRRKVKSPPSS